MISTMENAVLEIIKESLYNIPTNIVVSSDFSAIFEELKSQSLLPITYVWMKRQISLGDNIKKEWTKVYASQTYRWYAMMKEQSDIIDLLSRKGYSVAVMKGNSIALYYPKPQLRGSSDIDLLVRWEEYDKIYDLLLKNGYQLIGEKQEKKHHFSVCRKQYVIEVHKRPGGTRLTGTKEQTELLGFFQEGLNYVEWTECCGYRIPVLPPIYNAMILLLHTAQHMTEGIGLRHIIDWMMFAEHCAVDDFWNRELKPMAAKGQVDTLAQVCTKMCQKYLGLTTAITWCQDASDQTGQELMEYLFYQGDFGTKAGANDAETEFWTASRDIKSFCKRLNNSSLYSMPLARKHKLLLPIAWVYQMGRYVRQGIGREKPVSTMIESQKEANRRRNLFADLRISE